VSDFNSTHNRAVWFDIPVADLDRASAFYRGVLAIAVDKTQFNDFTFCLLEHHDGNGGCLILKPDEVASNAGILLYMNVNGRIREAVGRVTAQGGECSSRCTPLDRMAFAPSCSTAKAIASPCTRRPMLKRDARGCPPGPPHIAARGA
jgi:predicted enzyme related to lactoylglutathione lyase